MQSRAELFRNPGLVIALLSALLLALVAGATIGYLAKPASAGAGPARYFVLTTVDTSPGADACVHDAGHKAC